MNNMHKKGKPVFRMTKGGDVTKMSRTELEDYISKNYLPHLSKARMYFSFYETGYDYDLLGDSKLQRNALLKYYTDNSDFTESSLAENSNYKITDGWEKVSVEKSLNKALNFILDSFKFMNSVASPSGKNSEEVSSIGITFSRIISSHFTVNLSVGNLSIFLWGHSEEIFQYFFLPHSFS